MTVNACTHNYCSRCAVWLTSTFVRNKRISGHRAVSRTRLRKLEWGVMTAADRAQVIEQGTHRLLSGAVASPEHRRRRGRCGSCYAAAPPAAASARPGQTAAVPCCGR